VPAPAAGGGCVLVGLTGGIGAGKSTVAALFAELGAGVIDADAIVHQLLAPSGAAVEAVCAHFGRGVLDERGGIDRSRLGQLVFDDPEARERLETLLHPLVIEASEARIAKMLADDPSMEVLIYEAALLVETGRAARFDRLVLVTAPIEVRIARLEQRGLSARAARRRIEAQLPDEQKASLADHVIDNGGPLSQTRDQVEAVYRTLRGEA